MIACTDCGTDWSQGNFSPGCTQCGGGALATPCPICGGRCGARWQRALFDSQDENLAHWYGRCALPEEEQRALLSETLIPDP